MKEKRTSFFTIFTDRSGLFRWNFKAKNNKVIADSGEGYTTKQNAEKGMNALIEAIKNDDFTIKSQEK